MESWKQREMNNSYSHRRRARTTVVRGGRSKHNPPCKKHPNHEQSPGVCSVCLNLKLSKLSENPNYSSRWRYRRHGPSSSSVYSSDTSSSSYGSSCLESPAMSFTCPYADVLKKSRSAAAALHRRKGKDGKDNGGSIKRRFWSKLFFGRRNL